MSEEEKIKYDLKAIRDVMNNFEDRLSDVMKNRVDDVSNYISKLQKENEELENENFNLKEKEIINKYVVPEEKNFYDYYGTDKNKEEKGAIEKAKKQIEDAHNLDDINIFMTDSTTLKILLNLIDKQQKEIEKYKRLAEANLKDSQEFQDNMCNHRCIKNNEVLELKEAMEDLKLAIEQDKEELPYSKESLKNKQVLLNYIAELKKEIKKEKVLEENHRTAFEKQTEILYEVEGLYKTEKERVTKLEKENENAKWYIHQMIVRLSETIRDYIDDDKIGNKDIIGELKETRKQWQDVEKLLNGESKDNLYNDWRIFGEYE